MKTSVASEGVTKHLDTHFTQHTLSLQGASVILIYLTGGEYPTIKH